MSSLIQDVASDLTDAYEELVVDLATGMLEKRKNDVFTNREHAEEHLDDLIKSYIPDQEAACLILAASESRNAWVGRIDIDENIDPDCPEYGPFDAMAYYTVRTDVAAHLDLFGAWKLYESE